MMFDGTFDAPLIVNVEKAKIFCKKYLQTFQSKYEHAGSYVSMTIYVSDLHENIENQGYWQKCIWVINCSGCRTQQQLEAYFNLPSMTTCEKISFDLMIHTHTNLVVIFDERFYLCIKSVNLKISFAAGH